MTDVGCQTLDMSEKPEENTLAPERGRAQDEESQPRLKGCVPLSHQVAGHKYGINEIGILQHPDGTVLKQLQPPPRGPREMQFYTQVFAEDCTDPTVLALRPHLPRFYGTWTSSDSPNGVFLKLEDVTRRFSRPCIMDVKVGRCSYDPLASPEKRQQQIRKYPLMEEIGFLLLGMRVYDPRRDCYVCYDRLFGRSLGKDTLVEGLSQFFHNGVELRRQAVHLCIGKVRNILRWFNSQKQLHFYGSSLLFVYEGAPGARSEAEHNNNYNNHYNHHHHQPQDSFLMGTPTKSSSGQAEREGDLPERLGNGAQTHSSAPHVGQSNGNGECVVEEEGKEGGWSGEEGSEDHVEVRMIDFAHVFPSLSPDEGYMHGLKNLLSTLEKILQE